MLAFRLASASDFQPTTPTVTAVILMVTIRPVTTPTARHIINRLSIIAPCTDLITGGTATAYLFSIATFGVKRLTRFVNTGSIPYRGGIRFSQRLTPPKIKAAVYHRGRHR